MRRALARLGALVVLFGLDRGLATLAVERNAAGALLAPRGVELEALAIAGAFLLVRLTFAVLLCAGAARLAAAAVRRLWPAPDAP